MDDRPIVALAPLQRLFNGLKLALPLMFVHRIFVYNLLLPWAQIPMRLFAHVENQLSHTASRREKQQNGDGPGMDGVGEAFAHGELALLDNPAGAWMGRLLSALLDDNQVGRGFGDVPAPIGHPGGS
jgi:hypothetical protein